MNFLHRAFYRFSLDQKIIALIAFEFFGLLVITLVAWQQIKSVSAEVDQLTFARHDLMRQLNTLESHKLQLLEAHLALVLQRTSPRPKAADITAAERALGASVSDLLQQSLALRESIYKTSQQEKKSGELHLLVSRYKDGFFAALDSFDKSVASYRSALERWQKQPGPAAAYASLPSRTIAATTLDSSLQILRAQLDTLQNASDRHLQSTERVAIGFLILTSVVALLSFVMAVLLIVRMNISKPLQLLTDTINSFTARQRVEETELEFELMGRRDELGRMSRSFNRLKHDLWHQGQALEDAREQAENANRGKSMFLAAASHDLRQPLNAMQMYIAALRLKVDNPAARAIIEDIDAVSLSTARLLNALLDVSQLEVGAIEPQFENFAVQEVLRRTHRSFSPVAKQKNLQLTLVSCAAWVHSDPVLLERILGNFISNAIRYTRNGKVLIGCRRRGAQLSIEVLDTGCGIPPEQVNAIFEDFHQVENSERDKGKGLGLGLAIARRLSVRLGHDIFCDSIVERGSHFAVAVDKVPSETRATEPTEHVSLLEQSLSGTRVLLIEDDLEVLKATEQLLTSWGCKVYSGREMNEINKLMGGENPPIPDLIVADYRLPGNANGTEVSTRVQLMTGRAIPVVIVTGDVEKDHLKDMAEQGYRVLCKPVRPAKLRALITHLIAKDQLQSSMVINKR